MEIALISFQIDSYNQGIATSYIDWLAEALRKYEDREGRLPGLVLSDIVFLDIEASGLTPALSSKLAALRQIFASDNRRSAPRSASALSPRSRS